MASYDDTATVSGTVVGFNNGADSVPIKNWLVTLPASLDGYSEVNGVQSGLQIADFENNLNSTSYGCTIEKLSGGGIRFHGTTTQTYLNLTSLFDCEIKSGVSITLSRATARPYRVYVYLKFEDNTTANVIIKQNTSSVTYTTAKKVVQIRLDASGLTDSTAYDETLYIVLQYGSTAHNYEPYQTPTTYTANLGRTIYGGLVDIVNGVGKDNCKKIALGDLTWIKSGTEGNFYCSQVTDIWYPSEGGISRYGIGVSDEFEFVQGAPTDGQINCYFNTAYSGYRIFIKKEDYADRTSADFKEYLQNINAHLVYKVNEATETDFTFDGQEINTRLGYNAFWSEQGNTELTYYKDGYGYTSVTVNKTGKNLFDISKVATTGTTAGISWSVSGNEITISGTATSSGWKTFVEFKLPHKGTYHFHMNATGNVGYFLRGWTQLVGKDVTEVCNDPSQVYRIAIAVTTAGQTYEGTISEIQIEVGDAYTSYEPYEAVSKTAYLHKVIYGGEVDVIKGTAKPKNLFNEDWEVGGINDATGLPNSETNKIRSKTFSSIKGGATCYVGVPKNIRVLFYASDESFISETANIMNSTFTTPVNCSLFKIRGTVDYGTTYNDDIIICYGSSASEYVPHFEPFTFPPISMETDDGENTLFANEGDSAITYRKAVD